MAIFCKIADKKAYQYRLKERFDSRHTQVTKINDTSGEMSIKICSQSILDLVGLLSWVDEWAWSKLVSYCPILTRLPISERAHRDAPLVTHPCRCPRALDYKNAIRLEQSTHGDEETIVLTTDSPAERDELYGVLMYAKTTRFLEQQLQKKVQEYERDLPSLM